MTVATFQDYMQKITADRLKEYENPGPKGNLVLIRDYMQSDRSFRTVTVFILDNMAQDSLNFGIFGTVIGGIAAFATGALSVFPTIYTASTMAGMFYSIPKSIVTFRCSDEYRIWKGRKFGIEDNTIKIFKEFLSEDVVLKNFICPYSKFLPEIPVKAPDKLTYERDEILQMIKSKGPNASPSAYLVEHFTENELVFDHEHFNHVIKRIKVLVEQELNRSDLSPNNIRIIKDGLLVYKNNMDTNCYYFFQQLIKNSNEKFDRLCQLEIDRKVNPWDAHKKYERLRLEEREYIYDSFKPVQLTIEDKND